MPLKLPPSSHLQVSPCVILFCPLFSPNPSSVALLTVRRHASVSAVLLLHKHARGQPRWAERAAIERALRRATALKSQASHTIMGTSVRGGQWAALLSQRVVGQPGHAAVGRLRRRHYDRWC